MKLSLSHFNFLQRKNVPKKLVVFTSSKPSQQVLDYVKNTLKKEKVEVLFVGIKPSVTENDFEKLPDVGVVFVDGSRVEPIAKELIDSLSAGLFLSFGGGLTTSIPEELKLNVVSFYFPSVTILKHDLDRVIDKLFFR